MKNELYAAVIVDVPSRAVDRPFHYRIPISMLETVRPGHRVYIPFGPRRLTGYVIERLSEAEVDNTREIMGLVDAEPLLTAELVELVKWMADRYQCLLIEAIRAVIPPGIHITGVKGLRMKMSLKQAQEAGGAFSALSPKSKNLFERLATTSSAVPLSQLSSDTQEIEELLGQGLAEMTNIWLDPKVKPKYVNVCCLADDVESADKLANELEAKAPKQAATLRALAKEDGCHSPTELARLVGTTASTVAALRDKGFLTIRTLESRRDPLAGRTFRAFSGFVPNPQQHEALEQLVSGFESKDGSAFLLHGVTGSGKTEVYLQLIEKAIGAGKTAITLVPEISLTPQTVRRFKERFGAEVAVLHSRLSMGERYDEWRRIRNGDVKVVVGARSAIFAPLQDLGVIIIDEEHESSYKQEENPKYHARDVALYRARQTGALVVLGTATPSVESYYQALSGNFTKLEMMQRVEERPLPPVEIVDMRAELAKGNRTIFSETFKSNLAGCLASGHQAILLLNRRGFSTFVLCRECGNVLQCPDCRVSLTYHKHGNQVMCHYCGHARPVPPVCPDCGSRYLRQFGAGTERVAAELGAEFPKARILRMDVDTTSTKGAHERILEQFGQGQADFLVGTQMIAKGLDFPNVTFVGVVTADTALNLPDFRAGERTFQLMTQVAGRAGRGEVPGNVVIQTYTPDHYSITAAQNHDYHSYIQRELAFRQTMGYPPFVSLGRVLMTGESERQVLVEGQRVAEICRTWVQASRIQRGQVIGPTPAALSKLKGKYRWHVLIKLPDREQVKDLFAYLRNGAYDKKDDVKVSFDIEPLSLV